MSAHFDTFHFEEFTEGVNKTPLVFNILSNNKYLKDLSVWLKFFNLRKSYKRLKKIKLK